MKTEVFCLKKNNRKFSLFNLVECFYYKTYPNIKSIQLCKFCDTNSDSRALRCIEMKSSGDLAHGGKITSSTRSFVFCNDPRSNLKKTSRFTHFVAIR